MHRGADGRHRLLHDRAHLLGPSIEHVGYEIRLVGHLGMTRAEFLAQYTIESEEEGRILRRGEGGCVFLEGTACTVYDAKPDTCSRFPHLVRGNGSIASRMWQFIDRACYCPIVYNALEAFKTETKFTK